MLKSKGLVMMKLYGVAVLILANSFFAGCDSDGIMAETKTTVSESSTTVASTSNNGALSSTTTGKKADSDDLKEIVSKCNKEANDVLGDRNANKTALTCCVDRYTSDCVAKNCNGCSDIQKKRAVNVKKSCEMEQISLTLAQCKSLSVKVNYPLIIGCVVGGIFIIILLIAIVAVCRKKFCNSDKKAEGEEVKFKLGKHMNLESEVSEVVVDPSNAGSTAPASSAVSGVSGVSSVAPKANSVAGSKSKLANNSALKGGKDGKDAGGGSKNKAKKKASKAGSKHGGSKEKVGGSKDKAGKGKAKGNASKV